MPLSAAADARWYFNSRPSARGDILYLLPLPQLQISIHAPPRGATACGVQPDVRKDISIHAPPRGATKQPKKYSAEALFQFTPLREGRRRTRSQSLRRGEYFNSRPSARGDRTITRSRQQCLFQFTPLREGRQHEYDFGTLRFYFNSRPSARGDGRGRTDSRRGQISIHAPPRGATCPKRAISPSHIFQFTPLREGRRRASGWISTTRLFQFTPLREGRRRLARPPPPLETISIHAPPRGATEKYGQWQGTVSISIHAPPRGATPTCLYYSRIFLFQFTPLREGRRSEKAL